MFFVSLTEWSLRNVLLRMAAALLLGGLIGIDRGAKKRGGGARTDAAVCLGAAMVMMTAQYMDIVFPGSTDISRMAAQVGLAAGIGFVDGAILVTAVLLVGLHLLPFVEEKAYQYSRYARLYIEGEENRTASVLLSRLKADGCKIDMYDVDKPKTGGQSFTIRMTIYIPYRLNKQEYLQKLSEIEGVMFVDVI